MRRPRHSRSGGLPPDDLAAAARLDQADEELVPAMERELRELKAADRTAKRAGEDDAREALGLKIADLMQRIAAAKGAARG
jgi:hypothetical protein